MAENEPGSQEYQVTELVDHGITALDFSDKALAETARIMALIESGETKGIDPDILISYDLIEATPIAEEDKDDLPPEAFR